MYTKYVPNKIDSTILRDGQIISVKMQKKGILSLYAEGGRLDNFKAELMQVIVCNLIHVDIGDGQIISVKIQKRYTKFMCRRKQIQKF
jgi:hypothetical protein